MRTILCLLLGLGLSAPAFALGQLADIQVYDRKTRSLLPVYGQDGRFYVAGEPGHEYSVRVRNRSGARLLAVTSVDGVNVISGATAEPSQSGYVLAPYAGMDIEGWRKSLQRTAAFYFTKLKHSYAARTGRPDNVGVIGVALFRERLPEPSPSPCCWPFRSGDGGSAPHADAAREAAPAEPQRKSNALGTGHGRSEHSLASYTQFERASDAADEVVVIYYDSRKNLLAQGILPTAHYAEARRPEPFPGSFVPDP